MRKNLCRCISVFLAVVLLLGCAVTPAFASSGALSGGILIDSASVSAWNSFIASRLKSEEGVSTAQNLYWTSMDSIVSHAGIGTCSSSDELFRRTRQLSTSSSGDFIRLLEYLLDSFTFLFTDPVFDVRYDSEFGVYRPYHVGAGLWVVNSQGYFPYYKVEEVVADETKPTVGGKWIRTDLIKSVELNVLSQAALQNMADVLNRDSAPFKCSVLPYKNDFLAIYAPEDDRYSYREIYCDSSGRPYVAQAKPDNAAVNQSNNYYTEINQNNQTNNNVNIIDQGTTENNTLIDVDSNMVWFPDGTFNYINQLLYDESTKTYYVDSHDSYTWNSTTNNYTTNNYYSFYQYHINYTSITYIGTTAEYDETYELYYQLPDGRSSADLTAEDLEQLSLVFADVTNYKRSADDVSQRVLYHFDGDTQDSSYWSYCSDFHWNSGASLTYMDEGTFGGSLYLDETEHDFIITLPNNDVVGDFTLQFRYYQSYTAAPKLDSYIELSGSKILLMNGASYYTGSGTLIAQTSIGTWNELCLLRKNGVLYYYINGVYYSSVSDTIYSGNTIRFYFGSAQQTYKKIDELRFTKGAVYSAEKNYAPTAVPFDTNLSLVLPDGEVPVADEYFDVVPGSDNLLSNVGLADWSDYSKISSSGHFIVHKSTSTFIDNQEKVFISCDRSASFSSTGSSTKVTFSGIYSSSPDYTGSGYRWVDNCFFLPVVKYNGSGYALANFFGEDLASYCFSVLLSDGSYSYIVFRRNSNSNYTIIVEQSVINSNVNFACTRYESSYCTNGIVIYPVNGTTLDIAYMELIRGTKPSFKLNWKTAVYSSGQLEEAPVLAVRSNLDVTTYQIGGVRPSYPVRGQVWALVENSRITSLQQYNGSAWVAVDGRIWTGERWIPCGSFDVVTLQDCYDIVDSSGTDYEYIYTESGFWSWWQKSWNGFTAKLDRWFERLLAALGGSSSGDGFDDGSGSGGSSGVGFWERIKNAFADGLASIIELVFDFIELVLEQLFGLAKDLLSFFFDMLSDMVISSLSSFFSVFTDGSLFGFFQQEQVAEDGTVITTVVLPNDIASVFGFFSAVILLLPDELRTILIFGVAAMILVSVFKLVKS